MNDYFSARQFLIRTSCAFTVFTCFMTTGANCAVIRNFDSVPAGDSIIGGAVLSGPGAPGNPASQMNNTAAPAWGNQAADYTGQYIIGNANLIGELGTSSLSAFTLTYAYKPDVPNDPDASARQFAFRQEPPGGLETLGISMAGRRQFVEINGVAAGLPAFTPAARLMDGDPLTISEPDMGPCCSTESEWVFFAMTYEVLIPTVAARVKLYGMAPSEAAFGLQEIHTTTGFFGDAVDLTGRAAILGNTGFGGGTVNRPADSSFDALTIHAGVLSVDEIAALGRGVIFAVPEPNGLVVFMLGCLVVAMQRRKCRWKPWESC